MKKLLVGCFAVSLLVGCEVEETTSEPVTEEEEVVVEDVEETEEDQETLEKIILAMIEENFEGIAEVSFDSENKIYKIKPTDAGFVIEMSEIMNGTRSLDSWNNLVESMRGVSESAMDTLGTGYALSLLNPVNEDNSLVFVVDGVVLYDVFRGE